MTTPRREIAPGFARLWLDHFPEWPVRYSHPRDNMPDYGRDRTALVSSGALTAQELERGLQAQQSTTTATNQPLLGEILVEQCAVPPALIQASRLRTKLPPCTTEPTRST